jgi:methyltransferase-like protein 23
MAHNVEQDSSASLGSLRDAGPKSPCPTEGQEPTGSYFQSSHGRSENAETPARRLLRSAIGMHSRTEPQPLLRTTAGDFPLNEYRLRRAGREWTVLHVSSVLSYEDELHFLGEHSTPLPYGIALWPAAIALAHDVASRADAFGGRRVLELGSGTGLPGIVAASFGGRVVQTDRNKLTMYLCGLNGERNGVERIEYRLTDWAAWDDAGYYEWILGSDVLYAEETHPHLRRIFESNLAPGGRVLLSDPFRRAGLRLLEAMEEGGWRITLTKWSVGGEAAPRPIAVYELEPPRSGPPG